jgi:uncharacterized protein (DUF2236 family)
MTWYVQPDSIVRRIWGDEDLVILIFGAGAAEFALNRAVDWLFFTGAIPNDPIGRLFDTAAYAKDTIFAEAEVAERTLAQVRAIHEAVERKRGGVIPAWAHRDVLYMLIDYSERVYQTLYRPLLPAEQEELFDVFRRMGTSLGIPDLPQDYSSWQRDRQLHLENDLAYSPYTKALYDAYRRNLGLWRYVMLRQIQTVLVPEHVRQLLKLPKFAWIRPSTWLYATLIKLGLRSVMHRALPPAQYVAAVERLHTPSPLLAPSHQ